MNDWHLKLATDLHVVPGLRIYGGSSASPPHDYVVVQSLGTGIAVLVKKHNINTSAKKQILVV
jgi:hypothetical protein